MNNNNFDNLVSKIMGLPAFVQVALIAAVPALMVMNHTAVMIFFILIPLFVQKLKYERVSEALIALPLIFVFGLFGLLMYIASFSKTVRGIISLKTYGFIFSITALLFGFMGKSFEFAVFKFNWYTLPERRFEIFLLSAFLYVVLNLFAKHSNSSTSENNVEHKESKTTEEPKEESKEESKETKKETEVKKEKEPKQEQIDPNNASFANVIRFEKYIRKDRQDS
ncbi:hypothetical protein [Bacillus toyonensis]|uniref:hypothetical protein n=1 Tax=Bacillus toyonensis TaxID=155322 RepID=UPI002E24D090|nr:hypothetical protein [Bacillus toyonensis]